MAAQVVHAAGESADPKPLPGTHAVALAASREELHRLELLLQREGFKIAPVYENEAPYDGEIMAIGVAPGSEGVQRWLRHLPLVGKEKPA